MIRRRWLQFSLRGFLAVVTVFSVLLGWSVERARRRGLAIDAIAALDGEIWYEHGTPMLEDPFCDNRHATHFWNDLRRLPVEIHLPEFVELDANVGRCIELAAPVQKLVIWQAVKDDALRHLNGLGEGCWVAFPHDEYLSDEAVAELEQRLSVEVSR